MDTIISDRADRDVLRALLVPEKFKGLAITRSDVKKIFILILGQGQECRKSFGRILTHDEFLKIPVKRITLWYEIDEFDVNTDDL